MKTNAVLFALVLVGCKIVGCKQTSTIGTSDASADPLPPVAGHGRAAERAPAADSLEAPRSTTASIAATPIDPKGANFQLTYYWIALRPKTDPDEVAIKDCKGNVLTMASKKWLRDATMEATARFVDVEGESRTINIAGPSCWSELLDCDSRWGLGVWDGASNDSYKLRPFRSIAIDRKVLTMGAWYYVKQLDGVTLPSPEAGTKHDGCVRAVDVGPAIRGNHVDFFSAYESAYRALQAGGLKGLDAVNIESGTVRCKTHIDHGF